MTSAAFRVELSTKCPGRFVCEYYCNKLSSSLTPNSSKEPLLSLENPPPFSLVKLRSRLPRAGEAPPRLLLPTLSLSHESSTSPSRLLRLHCFRHRLALHRCPRDSIFFAEGAVAVGCYQFWSNGMAELRRNGVGDDEEDHSILYYCFSDLPKLLAAGRKGGHTFSGSQRVTIKECLPKMPRDDAVAANFVAHFAPEQPNLHKFIMVFFGGQMGRLKRGKFFDLWVRILKMKCWEIINQEGFSNSNGKCSNPIKIVRIIEGFSPTKNRFFFEEVASLESSKGKILCCHFSSDGKLLASAGDDKKVFSVGHD